MKITWVNHASFIFEYDGIKLITDPWIEGTAFDNGWALLSKSVFKYEDFSQITHIWFSHEHPDHFSPPNLNKIPKEIRKKITVLFQDTTDRKVAEYCKKAGFGKIIEMEKDKYYSLSKNVECKCNPFFDGDSWLYIKTDKYNLLNLNDCLVNSLNSAEEIKKKTGKVDLLFTQFGYANKVGNVNDIDKRILASNEKLKRIELQARVFNPRKIIPFASFIYFSHIENSYMNIGMNRIDTVYTFITEKLKTETVVLYPGEEWSVTDEHNNKLSIDKYLVDYIKTEDKEINYLKSGNQYNIDDVLAESKVYKDKLLSVNKSYTLYKLLPSIRIWLTDINKSYKFNLNKGLYETKFEIAECDISLNSQALFYVFKFLWGGDTLQVNARFQAPEKGNYLRAKNYFDIAALTNRGKVNSVKSIFLQILRATNIFYTYMYLKTK